MSEQSEKEKRKEILKKLKEKEKEDFFKSLPMDKETFQGLFDYLDENMGDGCDHKLNLTIKYFEKNEIKEIEKVVGWLKENGGYCDCEVLANVEEKFE